MIFQIQSIIFIVLNAVILTALADTTADTADVYWLEHALDTIDFKEIGSLNLKLIKQNQYAAQFQSYNTDSDHLEQANRNNLEYSTQIESNQFDETTKQEIKNAFKQNNNSFYCLRLVKKQPFSIEASSFTYLKYLIESDFTVNLTLNTGFTGRLNGISIKTTPVSQSKRIDDVDFLKIYASVLSIKPGQIPETEVYLEKAKKEVEQKEKGAQGENQSFFSKYWIYIVPFVVIMFLMNLVNPEGGAAPAGR